MLTAERYRLVELIGRGAMGEVWRAEDTELGREVAVKLLLEHAAVDDAAERFRQEARISARLNHPNVVAAYDFGDEDGRCYLVMELVSGHSLRKELEAYGPLALGEARRVVGQAATGLVAAHACDVVHRDIKPANLLLADDGTVKIADFGIARATASSSSLTRKNALLGTSAYLAPERLRSRDSGPPSDVYALGCVLYETLCGRPPFFGEPAAVAYQHVNAQPQSPDELRSGVPAALAGFVLRMLAKDPLARPTAAETARFLAGESAETVAVAPATVAAATAPAATATAAAAAAEPGSPETPAPPGRGRRSRRAAVPVAAAAAAALLAAGYLGFHLGSGPGDTLRGPVPGESGPPTSSEPGRTPADGDQQSGPGDGRAALEHQPQTPDESPSGPAESEPAPQDTTDGPPAEETHGAPAEGSAGNPTDNAGNPTDNAAGNATGNATGHADGAGERGREQREEAGRKGTEGQGTRQ
ncbi:serine/threonine-protein kinase [Streptomyces lycii]|uniref:non-specific serine/threonine protein kinase n=1 Tax=Streptomyces lycii TaxID=2654337 RepID=A0ABQ7FB95_9ACTN|nr:serine/threonine-protein kinase [Streptomyces lycii]KAF4406035.1 protein kinase [Streptomyces lycii]